MHRVRQLRPDRGAREEDAVVLGFDDLADVREALHPRVVRPAGLPGERERRGGLPAVDEVRHDEPVHVVQRLLLVLRRARVDHEVEAVACRVALVGRHARHLHGQEVALGFHHGILGLDGHGRNGVAAEHRAALLEPVHLGQREGRDRVGGILGADSIATFPLPQMDWLKERCSMFSCHPIPPVAIKSQNPVMESEGYFLPVQMAGVTADKRYTTCYGFNFVVNARAPKDKQEALHDMYRFIMSDLVDCWQATAPFTLARKTGWTDDPRVKSFPHVGEIIKAKDNGVFFPRTPIWTELADAMHRAVQKVM